MNRKWIIALSAPLVIAIAYLLGGLPGREERAVRRQLHALARQCEKKPGQGMFRTLTDMGDLRAAFTSNAVIQLGRPYPMRPSPRELASLVARAHMEVESMEVVIQGIEFLPRPEADVIELLTAVALRFRRQEKAEEFVEEYRLRWRKQDGEWRIESARADSTIQSPW